MSDGGFLRDPRIEAEYAERGEPELRSTFQSKRYLLWFAYH